MKSFEEDILRIDEDLKFYQNWIKTKGLRKYEKEKREKRAKFDKFYVPCLFCGINVPLYKIRRYQIHINIMQEIPKKIFCSRKCKIKWGFTK